METTAEAKVLVQSIYSHMVEVRPNELMGTWNAMEGRLQNLYIEFLPEDIVFTSAFASVSDISAETALSVAHQTMYGLVVHNNKFAIRHIASLKNFNEYELHSGAQISGIADFLEQQISNRDIE